MLFSIIVPIFKSEDFINECIESILNQSEDNFELLLIDDGSPDGCAGICDVYAKKDSRVRVIHQENMGVHAARMMGTKQAKGEYLVFVDSDDELLPGALETLRLNIEMNNAPDVVFFQFEGHRHISANADVIKAGYYDRDAIEKKIIPYAIESRRCSFITGALWDKAFKRTLFQMIIPAEERLKMGEDRATSTPFVLNANTLLILENELYKYRVNPASVTYGRGPYPLSNPRMTCEIMERLSDLDRFDLREQEYRCLTHNVFVYAKSQFARNEPYKIIKKDIMEAINEPYYQNAIKKCHYGLTAKGWMAYICVRFQCIRLMKLFFDLGM